MTTLQELTVATAVTQNAAPTAANHLVRLADVPGLLAGLFGGTWNATTNYGAGVIAAAGNGLWQSLQANNLNHAPVAGSAWWQLLMAGGGGGGLTNLNLKVVAGATATLDVLLGQNLTGVTVNFVFEPVMPTTPETNGWTIDLTGQTAQTRVATVTDAVNGHAEYILTGTDTATPGIYRGQFQFVAAGVQQVYPQDGWIEFEVLAAAAASTANYLYVGYATDATGDNFSLSPTGASYVAFRTSATALTPAAADFAGRWVQFKGADGANGTNGTNGSGGSGGTPNQVYLAWASDASGTAFSTTPAAGLYYLGVVVMPTGTPANSATLTAPYAWQWFNTRGPAGAAGANGANGTNGANVYGYAGYATSSTGAGFATTPGAGLNYIQIILSATPISPLTAANFPSTGWMLYAGGGSGSGVTTADQLANGPATNFFYSAGLVLGTALTGLDGVASGPVLAADTLLAGVSKLNNGLQVVQGALASPGQALYAEGIIPVPYSSGTGAASGTLSTLALGFAPSKVQVTLNIPSGGTVIPLAVVGAPTTSGFAWKLASAVPAAGYQIFYRMT